MTLAETIGRKLKESSVKVDEYILSILEPRKPEVLYEAARHLIEAGGKRLRPYLVLRSCALVGGDPKQALPYAAALEVLHNFTLVHDDIMDNDDLRRGAPTVHAKWGVPMAIIGGDLLFAKVYEAMIDPAVRGEVPMERAVACIDRVNEATVLLCEGQALDSAFPNVDDVSTDDYLFMVGGKTSALFKACAEVGGIMGGADPEDVRSLGEFAWNAGIAFQIVDDVLGVTTDESTLGKPVGSDLREGKKTLIVIKALENASDEEGTTLKRVLGVHDFTESDLEAAREVLRSTGGIDFAMATAEEYVRKSEKAISTFPTSTAKKDLLDFVEYFTKRIF